MNNQLRADQQRQGVQQSDMSSNILEERDRDAPIHMAFDEREDQAGQPANQ